MAASTCSPWSTWQFVMLTQPTRSFLFCVSVMYFTKLAKSLFFTDCMATCLAITGRS